MEKNTKIYTKEELEALKSIENGNYQALSKGKFEKEKNKFQKMAKNTLKRKSINIRVFA